LGAGTAPVEAQATPGAQQSSTAAGFSAGIAAGGFAVVMGMILIGAMQDEPALQQSSGGVSSRFSDFMPQLETL
jgi:hypothetical protein